MCFGTDVRDFHCGLRAVNKDSFLALSCKCSGMEFATEMIGRAALCGQKISQTPVILYRDGRGYFFFFLFMGDGIRHLMLIMKLKRNFK